MNANAIALVTPRRGRRRLFPRALLVLGLALGPIGCSTTPRGGAGPANSTNADYAALELNEGKKWVVVEPMMVHIRQLEQEVRDFGKTPGSDHARLAAEIQEHLGRLVTNCTMEGKAHDELHKWLMPFLALSTDYAQATEPQVQQQKLQEIKSALLVFNDYFE